METKDYSFVSSGGGGDFKYLLLAIAICFLAFVSMAVASLIRTAQSAKDHQKEVGIATKVDNSAT
ncbi:MAG: hypothetical protein FJ146_15675 [Deltaproteobacteria bacterium]|nr:hypothetical protein [Deltaproteobacteria bacterium]